jgi:hypothetical protein
MTSRNQPILDEHVTFRRSDEYDGYSVVFRNECVGYVSRAWLSSHIRRGRMQVSPWWTPLNERGEPLDEPLMSRRAAAAVVIGLHDRAPVPA